MVSDLIGQVALVALGWLLGVLSQGIEQRRQESLERRRVLTRLDRILLTIVVEQEVKKLSSPSTLLEPPALPEDFDRMVDQLGDWEARRGEYTLHSQLITLKRIIEVVSGSYAILNEEDGVAESLLSVYENQLKEVKGRTLGLINNLRTAQLGIIGRIRKRLRWQSFETIETKTDQERVQPKPSNPAAPADQKASLPDR